MMQRMRKECEELLRNVLTSEAKNTEFMQEQTGASQALASKTRGEFTELLAPPAPGTHRRGRKNLQSSGHLTAP